MWGMRCKDPSGSGRVLFDTTVDETMFYWDQFTVDLPTLSTTTRSYPALVGKRIYISEVVQDRFGTFNGHPSQQLSVTYPNGVPTVTVAAAPVANPGGAIAYKHITVMTDGSHDEGNTGAWGARFLNEGKRLTITKELDAYCYLRGIPIGAGSNGKATVDFYCGGIPLVYLDVLSPGIIFDGIYKLSGTNMWRAAFRGVPLSNNNAIRIFGRMSLNHPQGGTEPWGYKQRREDGSGIVTFDSSLSMLALKGYTANTLVNVGNSNATLALGFPTDNISFNGWIYNYRVFERWVRGSYTGVGSLYNWTVTSQTYAYTFVASGNNLSWQERFLGTASGIVQDEYDTSPYEVTIRQPETIRINTIMSFIDNARYPLL